MPEREPQFNASFTLVRQREDDAEHKWRIDESHQQIVVEEGLMDEPDVAIGEDVFHRRMVVALGVPASKLPDVLDAAEELGGFLDMRKRELRDEIIRRLRTALGMPSPEEEDQDA
ncbi:MAG TPA: hypothetical protein PKV72_04160 [Candidatus Peribacteria bacterium]|nr:hypothetical protein [Candidatus Peribacteria bacterium]